MTKEYTVHVYTEVKETYYVEADSPEDARNRWSDTPMQFSECLEVADVKVREN